MSSLLELMALLKCPTSKVIAETSMRFTTNMTADVKTGRQRAAGHSSKGNSSTTSTSMSHQVGGSRKIIIPVATATATSATTPSMSSLRGGGARRAAATPMISGATVMMPIESEATHCCQTIQGDTSGLWLSLYATAPPTPETTVPTIVAASSPST